MVLMRGSVRDATLWISLRKLLFQKDLPCMLMGNCSTAHFTYLSQQQAPLVGWVLPSGFAMVRDFPMKSEIPGGAFVGGKVQVTCG